jgi:hypothetical protein
VPVTPFHFGPALIAKAALRQRFSLGVFALVQGVVDVESVWNILHGYWPAHTRLHTFVGALLVGAVCVPLGRALGTRANAALGRVARARTDVPACLAAEFQPVTWVGALAGALFGAVSHVLLDGLIHMDMAPLRPWREGNPFLIPESFEFVHLACTVAGVLGGVAWLLAARAQPARGAPR